MIQLYECPNCGDSSAAFAKVGGLTYCPACVPMPGKKRHEFKPWPIMLGGVALEDATATRVTNYGHKLNRANLISGVCCGDSGDCAHECGIA